MKWAFIEEPFKPFFVLVGADACPIPARSLVRFWAFSQPELSVPSQDQARWARDGLFLQVSEDFFDHCRILDAGDHFDGAAALLARSLQILNTRLNLKRTLKHSDLESPEGSVLPKV